MARTRGNAPDTAGTPATVALAAAGVEFTVHSYPHDPSAQSYGLEAAEALGLDPAEVFKTLVVDTDKGLAVGIVPVDRSLDLKAVASALGVKKATMADPRAAERATGYVLGGISPVGQKRALPTVLDASAATLERLYVSAGRRGCDIGLAVADLVRVTGATVRPIAR